MQDTTYTGDIMTGTIIQCIAYLSTQKEGMFDVVPHEEKRSLNANALYRKMAGQIAQVLNISNARIHNQLLRKYGPEEIVGGDRVWIALDDTEEVEKQVEEDENNHFKPTMRKTGSKRWYILMKPSHEFSVKEMSRLIDGTAEEMRQMGLVPPTDEEVEKAIARFEKSKEKK